MSKYPRKIFSDWDKHGVATDIIFNNSIQFTLTRWLEDCGQSIIFVLCPCNVKNTSGKIIIISTLPKMFKHCAQCPKFPMLPVTHIKEKYST